LLDESQLGAAATGLALDKGWSLAMAVLLSRLFKCLRKIQIYRFRLVVANWVCLGM
jgi:hypothetical protein